MPLTFHSYHTLNDEQLKQIEHVYATSPEFADGEDAAEQLKMALSLGDKVYTAEFNDKIIAAVWARGTTTESTCLLQYIVVHPANRGRGITAQLIEYAVNTEKAAGVRQFKPGCGAIQRTLHSIGAPL